ncbi:SCNN1A [Mytilus coruscus]|uniref:SCNN1A n=1 Tax=Mytilus coruscus TaxID=42192 RepID=A0A6J8E6A1_MYTCO|nr:SCNN1A [Mytilus coruscus]
MLPTRIKDTLRNFAVNTTLHGINRVSSSKHAIGKLLWACIVLTCVALCFRQIYTLGVQYGSKQVNTKISIRYQKVYFPAVSFCNLNPVSYSKIEEQYSEWNEYSFAAILGYDLYFEHQKIVTEIEKQFDDSTASYGKRKKRDIRGAVEDSHGKCTARNKYGIAESPRIYLKLTVVDLDVDPILRASGEFRLMMSSFGYLGDYEKETEQGIKALSADLSDFVIYCNFEGRQCNESVFVPFFDKYYGMCYRFPPEPITTKRAGPLFALQLIFNVNQSDYVPYIASEAGIRLSIHEHGSQPYLENNGISVATGFRTDISLVQFESFLSNIGGSFGLWIGMSAISIGELLELCFLLLRSMRRREKVTETQTDVNLNDTVESTILSNDRNTQFALDKPPVEGKSGISTDPVAFGERKPGPY